MSYLDNISSIASRTGRYNTNYALTWRGTTQWAGVPINQSSISQADWNLKNNVNLQSYSAPTTTDIFEQKRQELQKQLEKQKARMITEINIAKDRQAINYKIALQAWKFDTDSIEKLNKSEQAHKNSLAAYDSAIDSVKNATSIEALKNSGVKVGETIIPYSQILTMGSSMSEFPLNKEVAFNMQSKKTTEQPTTQQATVSPTTWAPITPVTPVRRGGRVLSTLGKGKWNTHSTNVPPKVEAPVEGAWISDKVLWGIQPIQTAEEIKTGEFNIPVYITDKDTLAKIESATTPQEKQAIVDMYNKTKVQEAGDSNVQFKNEADVNKDNVVSNEEAQGFMDKHAASYYNAAVAEQNKQTGVVEKKMDPGRQKVLDDIALGNGAKYQTTLDKSEEKYIAEKKQAIKSDRLINEFNELIGRWNTGTPDQRVQIKKDIENKISGIKQDDLDYKTNIWSLVQKTVQPQIAGLDKPKWPTVKTFEEYKAAYKALSPELKKQADEIAKMYKKQGNSNPIAIQNAMEEMARRTPTTTTPQPTETITSAKPDNTYSASINPADIKTVKVAGQVNSGGDTKVDMIEGSNKPGNLGQGQEQEPQAPKNIFRYN